MAIDFHSAQNAGTYASRAVDSGWPEEIGRILDVTGLFAADIGCGGGIYTTALAQMGAAHVTGIDFSAQMVADAEERRRRLAIDSVEFRQGRADHTGLPADCVDVVLQRALIHHLDAPQDAFAEARRILRPGGTLLIQDRTIDDVRAPASAQHVRGWFFEFYPRLLDVEQDRRPDPGHVEAQLAASGFTVVERHSFWEQRRTYSTVDELRSDLLARTGRSILHELTDAELTHLADEICAKVAAELSPDEPICEFDRWTVWRAQAAATSS